ncbi:type I methionyl aminopeptidase [Yinghuangia sp. ASG 101]|uniref:type I methionyl aminopeptidase n=1 Tax=Yinghuangia sp. ASG 101 TaxID=2896848 RepID=UPI001E3A43E7|nr:type I methionyl aminopeptidase [Yinghuangia sp. ASG 101]UGQ13141.1 type I methionyl aminopeptidase [Yinghuangia sp. ASG 101]
MVSLKSPAEIASMREAGRVVADTLRVVAEAARPGVTLRELDALAARHIRAAGAKPSFLGYRPYAELPPFPGVLCLSVNEVVVHGIPNDRALRDGDLLSVDCGAIVDGYHGDAAVTVGVGRVDAEARRLSDATREALEAATAQMLPGRRLGDVAHAVQCVAEAYGYGILRNHGGHGIGTSMHEDPHVPNTGRPGRGYRLREGVVLALEPMFVESGRTDYRVLADRWTLATADGTRAAHFENTVAVTSDGPRVLTAV